MPAGEDSDLGDLSRARSAHCRHAELTPIPACDDAEKEAFAGSVPRKEQRHKHQHDDSSEEEHTEHDGQKV